MFLINFITNKRKNENKQRAELTKRALVQSTKDIRMIIK